jgi:nitroimidazol reductase NimA-like FMN-containing flavoprotein (pyridoxamine 5'-phosphate oxidase superfamily)
MDHAPSERTRVKRLGKRALYDAETVHAILDATPHCTVGYVFNGTPYVTPTLQWREGRHVYWHGSSASRMLQACEEAEVCLSVYLVDGFVVARSAFNHSCNYRSVMAFGRAFKVTDPDEKLGRLRTFTERLFPGRWDILRPPTAQEIKATTVLGMALDEVSAKVRTGPPGDDEEDYAWPIWAGVIPVRREALAPTNDPRLLPGLSPPAHITGFSAG